MSSTMSGTELRELRQMLGLTLAEAGSLIGYSESAVSRFESGSRAIPRRAETIIRLVLKKDKNTKNLLDNGKK